MPGPLQSTYRMCVNWLTFGEPVEVPGQGHRRGVAMFWRPFQAFPQNGRQFCGQVLCRVAPGHRSPAGQRQFPLPQRFECRHFTKQRVVQGGSERVDIAGRPHPTALAGHLFGRHEGRGAEDAPSQGHGWFIQSQRQTEVANEWDQATVGPTFHQNVRWLEVAVDLRTRYRRSCKSSAIL